MKGLGTDLGRWRKSSYSEAQTNCVEAVLRENSEIGVRDSSRPDATALEFRVCQWTALLGRVRAG